MPISDYVRQLRAQVGSAFILVPCVTGLVLDQEGRLLLARNARDSDWSTIGGAIEPDESPENAVVREVWEETGLHVEPTRLRAVLGGPQFRFRYANGDEVGYVASIFDCRPVGGALRPDGNEIVEARFFHKSELQNLPLSAYAQAVLPVIWAPESIARVTWRPPNQRGVSQL